MKPEKDPVCLRVLRYNPRVDQAPYYRSYSVPVGEEKMTLLQALEYVYCEQDDTLAFRRYCCGLQFCNSCLMLVNGKRTHACLTLVVPGTEMEVGPLPARRVLRDLIVEES